MQRIGEDHQATVDTEEGQADGLLPIETPPFPIELEPHPIHRVARVSGLYLLQGLAPPLPSVEADPLPSPAPGPGPISAPEPIDRSPRLPRPPFDPVFPRQREELRIDVDGPHAQMKASGTLGGPIAYKVHWIANLTAALTRPGAPRVYFGPIFYKDPASPANFPYTQVQIRVIAHPDPAQRRATLTLSSVGGAQRVRTFPFTSATYHPVDFEFDSATGEAPTTTVNTCAHPNRPASLTCESLTIQRVFERAGFGVTTSPGGTVPVSGAGTDARWSDQEMHDAMQSFWSRFSSQARWAMWVFFASLSEQGTSLGGIMFDDIGAQHRQGTAIFNDSFVANAPDGDPNPAAWVQRMLFWTACHEMGHAFNLAHAWQKSLGTAWVPLADEPESRSFMNYPFRVSGGQTAFFADFEYRFSNAELLFMRHAPAKFVQMGNAAWFDHHGFEEAAVSPEPRFRLEARLNRERPLFEFLEPVRAELKLTNVSGEPQLIDRRVLEMSDDMTIVVKRDGQQAWQLRPFVQRCWLPEKRVLEPGESIYESAFVSAGRLGWMIAEPGYYTVQIALSLAEEDVVSAPLRVRVAPPRSYEEELLAQEFFTDDVGRIIGLDGSRFLEGGNDVLRAVAEQLSEQRVALHAELALGNVLATDYKELVEAPETPQGLGVELHPEAEEGRELLDRALTERPETAVESLGHVEFKAKLDRYSDLLAEQGDTEAAAGRQETLYNTLAAREVHGRKVAEPVLEEVDARRAAYRSGERRFERASEPAAAAPAPSKTAR